MLTSCISTLRVGSQGKNTLCRVLAVAWLLLIAGCAGTSERAKDGTEQRDKTADFSALMKSADEAYAKTDLDAAQVKYALAVKEKPDDVAALYKLRQDVIGFNKRLIAR